MPDSENPDPARPAGPAGLAGPAGPSRSRSGFAPAVLAAVLGGALAFWCAGRGWAVATVRRPAPLPPHLVTSTGRDLVPWAAAAAVVGIAGGLALVATRGWGRVVLAAVITLAGAVTAGGGLLGLGGAGAPDGARVTVGWPLLCTAGGLLVAAAGVLGLLRGRSWPAMGARYEPPAGSSTAPRAPDTPAELWDSLDRGDDPTRR